MTTDCQKAGRRKTPRRSEEDRGLRLVLPPLGGLRPGRALVAAAVWIRLEMPAGTRSRTGPGVDPEEAEEDEDVRMCSEFSSAFCR